MEGDDDSEAQPIFLQPVRGRYAPVQPLAPRDLK